MTDPRSPTSIYLEPLTVEAVEAVIAREQPEGLLAGLGGQTALNLTAALADGRASSSATRSGCSARRSRRSDMAEDREAFRDLLDRLGQPYAPSCDRRGRHAAERARRLGRAALAQIGLPAIVRPAFTLGGTGGGIVETEPAYRERVRAGLRASPIGQVMVERCLVGWQEIEYEVMRDADDTCIAVCSMENVDPLGVHTGDSIVVAPVQTLTDAVHQRLRSAALAIIRALGVEGGCNVQFALSPDSTEYAVIEVNPRVVAVVGARVARRRATRSPGSRRRSRSGRRLAEIPNVVTGTTVAAFEPALDYVVVKLPRFPFDKFPTADRTLGSQMKATGEVMAIDRTFGSALNKALRGLEQAGVGPLAEDAGLDARPSTTSPGSTPATPTPTSRSAGSTRPARPANATRHAQRTARADRASRSFLEPSDSPAVADSRPAAPRRPGGRSSARRPGSLAWFLAEMGRNVALEAEVAATGAATRGSGRRRGRRPCSPPSSAPGSATASWPAWPARPRTRSAPPGWPARARAGLRHGRHVRGRVRGRDAVLLLDLRRAGSAPEAPPVARPAALVIGSGPVRIGQGIEFDYCAVQAADTLRRAGWSAR